ncbi:hypothetical protein HYALB_00003533 [Hymenoscyphus albidus]|uniref:CENP-T/Histone H4 histone fold domain-containing protein n=1 Tax=Hymenoscyphus albidus TaxID=595503 RepID=A0A9N9LX84_9HELO|nr:hypothetical protein HYALB_00003533 [Hymenoscyphus albidus]
MSAKDSSGPSAVNRTVNNLSFKPKITPRKSELEDVSAEINETTHDALRQLANIPKPTTPRRAASAGPSPSHRSARRTPGAAQARTPGGVTKYGGSARKPIAVTPHGRAAQRELEARRAGLTPGKDRRKSGRQQRETPRDTLRTLSRLLAPKTQPLVQTPPPAKPPRKSYALPEFDDDDDDGFELKRPRLSLPIGEETDEDDDEDESLLLPPRSAGLEDEDFTVQSVELGRRARNEQPLSRLSRGSFGNIRMSDRFGNSSPFGAERYGDDSSVLGPTGYDDEDMNDMAGPPDENTETLNLGLDRGMLSLQSENDDIRPSGFTGDDTENTFLFTVPPREASEEPVDEPSGSPDLPVSNEPEIVDEVEIQMNDERMDMNEPSIIEDQVNDVEEPDMDEPESPEAASSALEMNTSIQDTTLGDFDITNQVRSKVGPRKKVKISKHGIQYPSLPAGVVKKLATTFARMGGNSKAKINKETLDAIMQATDWFFEQASDDLGAYAQHAGRKTIDESDVVTLMARQRQTNANTTPFSLAQKYLPRELLQELRMVPLPKLKKTRKLPTIEE